MPNATTTGVVGALALAAGIGGAALLTPEVRPEVHADGRWTCLLREAPSGRGEARAAGAVIKERDGAKIVIAPWSVGGAPAGEVERTPQYIADALAACRRYDQAHGVPAPRLAEWQGLAEVLRRGGVPLPPPTAGAP